MVLTNEKDENVECLFPAHVPPISLSRLSDTVYTVLVQFLYRFSLLTHKYIFAVHCGMRRLLLATSHLGAYKVNRLDIPSPPTQEKKFCVVLTRE